MFNECYIVVSSNLNLNWTLNNILIQFNTLKYISPTTSDNNSILRKHTILDYYIQLIEFVLYFFLIIHKM